MSTRVNPFSRNARRVMVGHQYTIDQKKKPSGRCDIDDGQLGCIGVAAARSSSQYAATARLWDAMDGAACAFAWAITASSKPVKACAWSLKDSPMSFVILQHIQ